MNEIKFKSGSNRYSSLQIGRGIAALLVVFHHTIGRAQVAGLPAEFSFGIGFLGVDFFFVLSGFIIAHSLSGNVGGVSSFLWRRAVRLLPVFWLVFAVSGLAVWIKPSLLGHPIHYSISELLQAAFLIRQDIADGRSNPPIVGVAWTLHHEVLFYAVAALWIWNRRFGLAVAVALLIGSLGLPTTYPATYFLNPLNLEFAFGVGAYLLHRWLPHQFAKGMLALGVVALPIAWHWWPPLDELVNQSRVWSVGLPLSLIVCSLAALEASIPRGCESRWIRSSLEQLGDWSYALYLTHYPVMLICLKAFKSLVHVPTVGSVVLYIMTTAAVAVGVSAILHLGFERPLQRVLNRIGPTAGPKSLG